MRTGRCRPSEPRLPSAVPDGSKDKSPRLKRDHGGWVLVAVAGIVLFSGSILELVEAIRKDGIVLVPVPSAAHARRRRRAVGGAPRVSMP